MQLIIINIVPFMANNSWKQHGYPLFYLPFIEAMDVSALFSTFVVINKMLLSRYSSLFLH